MPHEGWILLVIPDRWARVLLRGELQARGHEAIGMSVLSELFAYRAVDTALILVDDEAIAGVRRRVLDQIRQRYLYVPIIVLAGPETGWPPGAWDAVLRRPTTIAEIAARISKVGPGDEAFPMMATG